MLKSQSTNEIRVQSLKFWKFYALDLSLMNKLYTPQDILVFSMKQY